MDSVKFPWRQYPERFYMFKHFEIAYHGVVYVDHFGDAAYVARCRTVCQRNTGATLSPFNGFLFLQGIETMALRVERHVENARKVAEYLRDHAMVEWVNYVGFPENPLYPMAPEISGLEALLAVDVRRKGRARSGHKVLQRSTVVQADGEHGRRQVVGMSSRIDNAPPAHTGGNKRRLA